MRANWLFETTNVLFPPPSPDDPPDQHMRSPAAGNGRANREEFRWKEARNYQSAGRSASEASTCANNQYDIELERLRRGNISKAAKDRISRRLLDADEQRRFLVAYYVHVSPPARIKGFSAQHLFAADATRRWAARIGIRISEDGLIAILRGVPCRMYADEIGEFLKVGYEERQRLKLWTIRPCDKSPEEMDDLRLEKARERARRYRRRKGIMPRDVSTQPWLAMGLSRTTYYRRRQRETAASPTHSSNTSRSFRIPQVSPRRVSPRNPVERKPIGDAETLSAPAQVSAWGFAPPDLRYWGAAYD